MVVLKQLTAVWSKGGAEKEGTRVGGHVGHVCIVIQRYRENRKNILVEGIYINLNYKT